ncbi:MAG TPA: hypothetical protein VHF47_03605 [Acidimicrobiales bacterium]|nr:hypothetical protein [Acidimicrobiales bacterium]
MSELPPEVLEADPTGQPEDFDKFSSEDGDGLEGDVEEADF